MAATDVFNINGVQISMTCGTGSGDGVTIHPEHAEGLSDEQLLSAIKTGLDCYPDFELYSYVCEYILFGVIDLYELSNASDKLVERYLEKCRRFLEIKSFTISKDEIEAANRMIDGMDAILSGHRFVRPKAEKIKKSEKGYVYLIRAIEPNQHYKIGLSKTPVKRIESLDVKLPFPVEVIHLIKSNDMRTLEKALHEKFADKRVNGEWFLLSESDIEEICAMKGDE